MTPLGNTMPEKHEIRRDIEGIKLDSHCYTEPLITVSQFFLQHSSSWQPMADGHMERK